MAHRVVKKTIQKACITEVIVDHNGCQGGDSGHGGYVHFELRDKGNTALRDATSRCTRVSIGVEGDSEREMLIEAFEFAIQELKYNPNVVKDETIEH